MRGSPRASSCYQTVPGRCGAGTSGPRTGRSLYRTCRAGLASSQRRGGLSFYWRRGGRRHQDREGRAGHGVGGRSKGKRESETAPHHVILLFSLSLSPSSMTLMLQKIPASVCFYSTSRRYPFAITQAPKGVGRGKEHRCDRQEGDGLIRGDSAGLQIRTRVQDQRLQSRPASRWRCQGRR